MPPRPRTPVIRYPSNVVPTAISVLLEIACRFRHRLVSLLPAFGLETIIRGCAFSRKSVPVTVANRRTEWRQRRRAMRPYDDFGVIELAGICRALIVDIHRAEDVFLDVVVGARTQLGRFRTIDVVGFTSKRVRGIRAGGRPPAACLALSAVGRWFSPIPPDDSGGAPRSPCRSRSGGFQPTAETMGAVNAGAWWFVVWPAVLGAVALINWLWHR